MMRASVISICAVVAILHSALAIHVTERNDVTNDVITENTHIGNIGSDQKNLRHRKEPRSAQQARSNQEPAQRTDASEVESQPYNSAEDNEPTETSKTGQKSVTSNIHIEESDQQGSDLNPQDADLDTQGGDLDLRGGNTDLKRGDLDPRGDEQLEAASAGWGKHKQPWRTSLFEWMKYPSRRQGRPTRGSRRHLKKRQGGKARRLAARSRGRKRRRPSNVHSEQENQAQHPAPGERETPQRSSRRGSARDNADKSQQQPRRQQRQRQHPSRHSSSPPHLLSQLQPDDGNDELEDAVENDNEHDQGAASNNRYLGSSPHRTHRHRGLRNLRQPRTESRFYSNGASRRDSERSVLRSENYVRQGAGDVNVVLSSGSSPRRHLQQRRRHRHDATVGYGKREQTSSSRRQQQNSCRHVELENRELKKTYRTNMVFLKRLLAQALDRLIADPTHTLTQRTFCEAPSETSASQRRRFDVTRPGESLEPASEIPLILTGNQLGGRTQRPEYPTTSQSRSGSFPTDTDVTGNDADGDDALSELRHLFEREGLDLTGTNDNPDSATTLYRVTPPDGRPDSTQVDVRNQHGHHRTLGGSASGRLGRRGQYARTRPDRSRRMGAHAVPRPGSGDSSRGDTAATSRLDTDRNSRVDADAISRRNPGAATDAVSRRDPRVATDAVPRRDPRVATDAITRSGTDRNSRGRYDNLPRVGNEDASRAGTGFTSRADVEDHAQREATEGVLRRVTPTVSRGGADTISRVGSDSTSRVGHDSTSRGGPDSTSRGGHDSTSRGGHDSTSRGGHDSASHVGHDSTSRVGHDSTSRGGHDSTSHGGHDSTSRGGPDSGSRVGHDSTSRVGHDSTSRGGHDSTSRGGPDSASRVGPDSFRAGTDRRSDVGTAQNSGRPGKQRASPSLVSMEEVAGNGLADEDDRGDAKEYDNDDDGERNLESGGEGGKPEKAPVGSRDRPRKTVVIGTAADDTTVVEDCELGPWTDWSSPVGFGVIERRRYPVAEDEDCQVPSEEDELVMRVDIFVFNDTHTYYKAPEKVGQDFEADFTRRSHEPRDLLLVLDASGSIEPEDFEVMREGVDVMARLFCGGFGHGDLNNRLAILMFGSDLHIVHRFSDDQSQDTLREVIANMTQPNGNTCTGDALTFAKDVIFNPENGARPSAVHDTLLVTDGHSNCGEVTIQQGARLLRTVSNVFALGVGLANDPEARGELYSVVSDSDPRHIFSLARFLDFKAMLDSIQRRHQVGELPCLPIVLEDDETSSTTRPDHGPPAEEGQRK